jgi:2-iminobutanoate/2-iminopropanoate deaminase
MPVETIQTKRAPGAIGPYSQGVVAHHFLFTAGQIGLDPETGQLVAGDVAAQTTRALQNLAGVLAERGLDWHDVVRTTVFLQNLSDFAVVNEAYGKVLGDARPARSTVQVAALPRGAAVEIDAIAALRKKPE